MVTKAKTDTADKVEEPKDEEAGKLTVVADVEVGIDGKRYSFAAGKPIASDTPANVMLQLKNSGNLKEV